MPKAKRTCKRSPEIKVTTGCQATLMSFFQPKPRNVDPDRGSFKLDGTEKKNDKKISINPSSKNFTTSVKSEMSVDEPNSDDDVIIISEHLSSTNGKHMLKFEPKEDDAADIKQNSITKNNLSVKTPNKTGDIVPNCETNSHLALMESVETGGIKVEPVVEDQPLAQHSPIKNYIEVNPASEDGAVSQQYYHRHFLHVLETVLSEQENNILFNESDLKIINIFKMFHEKEQNLYIRLFGRKHKWLRLNTLKYPEISSNLSGFLDALVAADFLQDGKDLVDMDDTLKLLLMPELKQLCKHFGIGLEAKGKEQIIDAFKQHCQQQTSIKRFFNTGSIEKKVIFKAKELAGKCFKLQAEPRKVFIRLLLLFSLTGLAEDEEDSASGGQQKKLATLLMVEKGHLTFPEYEVNKQVPVFPDRESLIRYEQAKQLELDLLNSYNNKCFQEAYGLFLTAEQLYRDAENTEEFFRDSQQPVFLQRFTSSHLYIRCLNHGVDVLQKLKKYQDAVDLLWLLLKQQLYCKMHRGHWWDRLTLLLDYHLKKPELTYEALCQSFRDPNLRLAHKYILSKRAQKIIEQVKKQESKVNVNTSRKRKLPKEPADDSTSSFLVEVVEVVECFQEAPKVTIVGRLLSGNQTGYKNVFVLPSSKAADNDEDITLLSVEELAISHYRQEGYSQGIHGEGSTIISLFCLLFWDVIFGSGVPDVFRSQYQAWPLDLNTDMFYENRRTQINDKIHFIQHSSKVELENAVASCWEKYEGTTSLVAWDLFTGLNQVKELVHSFTNEALAGICERFAKDFRHCRSGFPDLIVWNPLTHEVKVVEVKGPNDRLSPKQIVWLHCLLQLKVPVEVCHINAVGAKKLHS